VRFDPSQAELRNKNGQWTLLAGNLWVKEFGTNDKDARNTLELVKAMQVRELGAIGQGRPVLEYMVANAPPGGFRGMSLKWYTFRSDRIELKQRFNDWQLEENTQPLLKFGSNRADAEKTMEMIRARRFTHMGVSVEPRQIPLVVFLSTSSSDPTMYAPRQPEFPKMEPPPIIRAGGTVTSPESRLIDSTSRTPFDFRQARLSRDRDGWKIKVGTDCGPDETDARKAWRAIQLFKFNEQHVLGEGENLLEYYLSNGQPPRAHVLGLEGTRFSADALLLRFMDNSWWIVEHNKRLLRFDSQERAAQALDIIKRYQFDEVVHIGRPKPFMMYFTTRKLY
jgi:hypothetical protein